MDAKERTGDCLKRIAFEIGRRQTGTKPFMVAGPIITNALEQAYQQGREDERERCVGIADNFIECIRHNAVFREPCGECVPCKIASQIREGEHGTTR